MKKTNFRLICCCSLFFALAGCGNIDWFPKYVRAPTTPDPFSFTGQSGVGIGVTVNSNAITVSGLTGATSPVSITGPTGSKYAINDAAAANATAAAGTVKNGDTVIVVLPTAATPGTSTTATLTIGNFNGIFTATTQLVVTPAFSAPALADGFIQEFATITSFDGVLGTHQISIADAPPSANAQYEITDAIGNVTVAFTNSPLTIPVLNGQRIYVRNLPSATTVTTTLTIDGLGIPLNLSHL